MPTIEYSDEAKFYFLDNYPYTFELLVEIEKLKFANAVPGQGHIELEPSCYVWFVMGHAVYYRLRGQTIIVAVVKPLE